MVLRYSNLFLLVAVATMLALVGNSWMSPTETKLQSNCVTYCTSRCTECPYCSGCMNQACVAECHCNQECKGRGFLNYQFGCQCLNLSLNPVAATPTLPLSQTLTTGAGVLPSVAEFRARYPHMLSNVPHHLHVPQVTVLPPETYDKVAHKVYDTVKEELKDISQKLHSEL